MLKWGTAVIAVVMFNSIPEANMHRVVGATSSALQTGSTSDVATLAEESTYAAKAGTINLIQWGQEFKNSTEGTRAIQVANETFREGAIGLMNAFNQEIQKMGVAPERKADYRRPQQKNMISTVAKTTSNQVNHTMPQDRKGDVFDHFPDMKSHGAPGRSWYTKDL